MRRMAWALSIALAIGTGLTACEPPPVSTGDAGGTVTDASSGDALVIEAGNDDATQADAGAADTAATDSAEPCVDGSLGCPCTAADLCEGQLVCVAGSCVDCDRGLLGCACFHDDSCLPGGDCESGVCVSCQLGSLGCECDAEGLCDSGLDCNGAYCLPESCQPGSLACSCDQGQCGFALRCDSSDLCVACTADQVGCPCAGDSCLGGLVCDPYSLDCRAPLSCVETACLPQQLCESGIGVDALCLEACVPGHAWDAASGQCLSQDLSCEPGVEGSILADCEALGMACVAVEHSAACIGCLPDHVFNDVDQPLAGCRALLTCDDLDCASQGRYCEHAVGVDAVCVCPPWQQEGSGEVCEPLTVANCTSGAANSIFALCEDLARSCETQGASASCGDCLPSWVLNAETLLCERTGDCSLIGCSAENRACDDLPYGHCTDCLPGFKDVGGACQPVVGFDELSCDASEFALREADHEDASCLALPCPAGQVYSQQAFGCMDAAAKCPPCTPASNPAVTARLWPETISDAADTCICESADGYYYDLSKGAQLPCDDDADGWLRMGVRSALESNDEVLRRNARCQLRSIDRVELVNELGQAREVKLCLVGAGDEAELIAVGPHDDPCEGSNSAVALYEANELDSAGDFANSEADQLGFQPAELNSLTKVCVSQTADFNANEVPDAAEWLGSEVNNPLLAPLAPFGYFVELHRGGYLASVFRSAGRFQISERSRCDLGASTDLALSYGNVGDVDPYWRSCTRRRVSSYQNDGDLPQVGRNLADWNCASKFASCDLGDPLLLGALDDQGVSEHGLCQSLNLPADAPWLGMTHHSQFQCAVVAPSELLPEGAPTLHTLADFHDPSVADSAGLLLLNDCQRQGGEAAGAGMSEQVPRYSCSVVDPDGAGPGVSSGDVYLAAQVYTEPTNPNGYVYQQGCIRECSYWLDPLCPDPDASCRTRVDGFGEIDCGHCAHQNQPCTIESNRGICREGFWDCGADDVEFCNTPAPEASDPLGGEDQDCDGFDGESALAVFVAPNGNDANPGTMGLPVASVEQGLALARDSSGAKTLVIVKLGSYQEAPFVNFGLGPVEWPLVLPAGVSIHGNFSRADCAPGELWCAKGPGTDGEVPRSEIVVARAIGLWLTDNDGSAQVLSHLRIATTGIDAINGAFRALLVNNSSQVRVEDCELVASRGEDGNNGAAWASPTANGLSGVRGGMPRESDDDEGCLSWTTVPGAGEGGAAPSCDLLRSGGAGGRGGRPGLGFNDGRDGNVGRDADNPGAPMFEGTGGAFGEGLGAGTFTNCPVEMGAQAGQDGKDGAHASTCTTGCQGRFTSSGFTPTSGQSGAPGGGGGGGGSGGGGGGYVNYYSGGASCSVYGGRAGGGGSGGCGGRGGRAGKGGGASVAAFVWGSQVAFERCKFVTLGGGQGGDGAIGQAGGAGGAGARNSEFPSCGSNSYSDGLLGDGGSLGGRGGNGGTGGLGGSSTGGAGGASIGIVVGGDGASVQQSDSSFDIADPGEGGAHGEGVLGAEVASDGIHCHVYSSDYCEVAP